MKPIRTLVLLASFGLAAPLAQAQLKVGTLDANKIFVEYYKTKDAENTLNEQRAAAKKEFDERVETLKKGMDAINKINVELEKPELSEDAKAAKLKEREEKVTEARALDKEVTEFKGTRERQLQEQFLRMRKGIIDDIMKVVNKEITDDGYDLVFDKSGLSAGQIPVVLYSRDDMDFSAKIIEKLNANAPKVKPAGE